MILVVNSLIGGTCNLLLPSGLSGQDGRGDGHHARGPGSIPGKVCKFQSFSIYVKEI